MSDETCSGGSELGWTREMASRHSRRYQTARNSVPTPWEAMYTSVGNEGLVDVHRCG